MRQHPHIIHINRALELQFRGDDLVNALNRSTQCTYANFRYASLLSQYNLIQIFCNFVGFRGFAKSMKPFIFSRSEVPESLKRFGLISVIKAPKARGFCSSPWSEKNRASTAVSGRYISACWRKLTAKSRGVSANSDQGQFLVARKKQPCKATGDTGALFGNLSTSRRELPCLLGALRWLHRAGVQTSNKEVVIMRSIIPDFVERQKCSPTLQELWTRCCSLTP